MLDSAFFVSGELTPRPVTLQDGTVHTVHFREVSASEVRAYQLAEQSEDEAVRANALSVLICACVCDPDGKPALTREQALKLKPKAANALLSEVMALNGMRSAEAKKPSPPEDSAGSGTS